MDDTDIVYPNLKLNLPNDPQFRSNKINLILDFFYL